MKGSQGIPALQLATRAAAAAGLAVGAAQLLELRYPIYALVSAVVVTDVSAKETRRLALPRFAGTVLGASIGAAIALFQPPPSLAPVTVALGILIAMFTTQVVGLKSATKVAGYVCGIVLLDHTNEPWTYALHRTIETVVGIAAAVAVSFVPKLLHERGAGGT